MATCRAAAGPGEAADGSDSEGDPAFDLLPAAEKRMIMKKRWAEEALGPPLIPC